MSEIFTSDELCRPTKLSSEILPTKNDCMLYALSRTKHGSYSRDTVISDLAREVKKIWNDDDCCPFTFKHIVKVFNKEIWEIYRHLQYEKCFPGVESQKTIT